MAEQPAPTIERSILPDWIPWVPIDTLVPFPGNARRGNIPGIKVSLRVTGQFRPLFVQQSTMHVVYGNQTLQAAVESDWKVIQALISPMSDEVASRVNVADNKYGDDATFMDEPILLQLEKIGTLEGTGFGPLEVDEIRARLNAKPPAPAAPHAKPSDARVAMSLGTLAWSMSKDEWAEFHAELVGQVGDDPLLQIELCKERLGIY